jgi:hypothetical protein
MFIEEETSTSDAVHQIIESLANEPQALDYLKSVWFCQLEKWAFCFHGDFDRTNNLQESHFHALKTSHLGHRSGWRIDTLVIKLVSEVMSNYILKETMGSPLALGLNSVGIDLSTIPVPNEDLDDRIIIIKHLLKTFKNRMNKAECNYDLIFHSLQALIHQL